MYIKMADILQDRETENYILDRFEINDRNNSWRDPIPHGIYMRLMRKGSIDVIMSDTPMEHRTNSMFVRKANGDVLIAGLGIGMVLMAIQNKPEVRSITVIEKSKEIIEMIVPQLPLNYKVNVIQGDIFKWVAPRGVKYDTIYFDIWEYINSDIYEEMKELKAKFRGKLRLKRENPYSFISCWAENEAKGNGRL